MCKPHGVFNETKNTKRVGPKVIKYQINKTNPQPHQTGKKNNKTEHENNKSNQINQPWKWTLASNVQKNIGRKREQPAILKFKQTTNALELLAGRR